MQWEEAHHLLINTHQRTVNITRGKDLLGCLVAVGGVFTGVVSFLATMSIFSCLTAWLKASTGLREDAVFGGTERVSWAMDALRVSAFRGIDVSSDASAVSFKEAEGTGGEACVVCIAGMRGDSLLCFEALRIRAITEGG